MTGFGIQAISFYTEGLLGYSRQNSKNIKQLLCHFIISSALNVGGPLMQCDKYEKISLTVTKIQYMAERRAFACVNAHRQTHKICFLQQVEEKVKEI